jgi:hypothetical protein
MRESHTTMTSEGKQPELLLGIVALAVINALWQRDHETLKSDDAPTLLPLLAVDTDVVKFYSDPAKNSGYLHLPGLLDKEQTGGTGREVRGPREVLSHIMGQFLFFGSDHLGARLLFPATWREIGRIRDAIASQASRSINESFANLRQARRYLDTLVRDYWRRSDATPRDFIETLRNRMADLYPAVFQEGAVREYKRLGDLFEGQRRNVLLAAEIVELDQALTEIEREMAPCTAIWKCCIQETSPQHERDERRALDDAETLATLELCNRWLTKNHRHYRIVLVTGSGRLFAASRLRWNVVESHHLPHAMVASMGSSGAHIFQYYADVLLAKGEDGAIELAERFTPLRDVRYFLADPGFLAYAQRDITKAAGGEQGGEGETNLTEWLQAFLLRMDKRDDFIALNCLSLSGGHLPIQRPHGWKAIDRPMTEGDIDIFSETWQNFLRQASFNHLFDEGVRQKGLSQLQTDLASLLSGEKDINQLLLDLLDEAHVDVSHAATNLSIVALASKAKGKGHDVALDRSVPPLVFLRFPEAQEIVADLLTQAAHPSYTAIQEHLETLKNKSFGVDPEHPFTRKYLDLLLRAYCFAVFREWKGALFLAKEAYQLAQLEMHWLKRGEGEDRITGREAAYLACVASRHAENFDSLGNFDKRCFEWTENLRSAIEREQYRDTFTPVLDLHRMRLESEQIAYDLMYYFYGKWSYPNEGDLLTSEAFQELNDDLESLVERIDTSAMGGYQSREVEIARIYILRQALVNLAQTRYLLGEDGMPVARCIDASVLARRLTEIESICNETFPYALHASDLHHHVGYLVRHMAGTLEPAEKGKAIQGLKKKIEESRKSSWALKYDVQKYLAILSCLEDQ